VWWCERVGVAKSRNPPTTDLTRRREAYWHEGMRSLIGVWRCLRAWSNDRGQRENLRLLRKNAWREAGYGSSGLVFARGRRVVCMGRAQDRGSCLNSLGSLRRVRVAAGRQGCGSGRIKLTASIHLMSVVRSSRVFVGRAI